MADISAYEFGRITIDGTQHSKDVIVVPGRVVPNWWRQEGHSLVVEDFSEVLDELPPNLIVGAGAYGRLSPDPGALEELRARGVDVQVMPTGEAVERYRTSDPDVTAAALHLTC